MTGGSFVGFLCPRDRDRLKLRVAVEPAFVTGLTDHTALLRVASGAIKKMAADLLFIVAWLLSNRGAPEITVCRPVINVYLARGHHHIRPHTKGCRPTTTRYSQWLWVVRALSSFHINTYVARAGRNSDKVFNKSSASGPAYSGLHLSR